MTAYVGIVIPSVRELYFARVSRERATRNQAAELQIVFTMPESAVVRRADSCAWVTLGQTRSTAAIYLRFVLGSSILFVTGPMPEAPVH